LFTKKWQSQRNSKEKVCPACTKKVKLTFSGKRFAFLFPICAVLIYFLWPVLGNGALGALIGIAIFAGTMQMERDIDV
jgi:hypothetical protein